MISVIINVITITDRNALLKQFNYARSDLQDLSRLTAVGPVGSTHQHADFRVYIDGKPIDFGQDIYQLKSAYVHVEEGIGDVMHVHATGITLQHFFNSVGIQLSSGCITFEGKKQCSTGSKTLKYYVNGRLNQDKEEYLIKDSDKILISYGDETEAEIQAQLKSITSLAEELS